MERDSPVVNRNIRDLQFPPETVIAGVVRDDELLIPSGTTRFAAGDRVIALARRQQETALHDLLAGQSLP